MLSPEALATSVTALAIAIAKDKTNEEIELLASVFVQLSDTLLTITTQRSFLEKK